jgi:hypothetical protein
MGAMKRFPVLFCVVGLLFLQSCDPVGMLDTLKSPPSVAGGTLNNAGRPTQEMSGNFQAELLRRFPVGSSEGNLRSALAADGFHLTCPKGGGRCDPHGRDYGYRWGGFPCSNDVDVEWLADENGRITSLTGNYVLGCV